MGHKNPDMDCLGAALGIATCASHSGMRPFIVLSERNEATADALREMDRLGLSDRLLISGPEALEMVKPIIEGIDNWTEETIHDVLMAAIAQAGLKNGAVLWPLRIAISGQASTPGGAIEIAWLLGKAETLLRLDAGLAKLA